MALTTSFTDNDENLELRHDRTHLILVENYMCQAEESKVSTYSDPGMMFFPVAVTYCIGIVWGR